MWFRAEREGWVWGPGPAQDRLPCPDGWQGLLLGCAMDLNTCGVEDLVALPGVGPATARAVVEFRNRRGRFNRVDELVDVPGIGPQTLGRLRAYLVVRHPPVTPE